MTRDVRAVAAWKFDRIIPCHGVRHTFYNNSELNVVKDVIESGGKAAWAAGFSSFL